MQKELLDSDFGKIVLRVSRTARMVSFRLKPDGLYITAPAGVSGTFLGKLLEENRPKLKKAFSTVSSKIDEAFVLDASRFSLRLQPGKMAGRYIARREGEGRWCLEYPIGTDFGQPAVQLELKGLIEKTLRASAKAYLPQRIKRLAEQRGFVYTSVSITAAKTRWGSCSSRKTISLSYYLMLLPERLIDYVLLHELVHTREMNHGPAFWRLLDEAVGEDSRQLCAALRNYRAGF